MFDRIADSLTYFQSSLGLREQRQQVLASNIANSDTPHYKARDMDFAAALQRIDSVAKGGGMSNMVSLHTTSSRHIDGQGSSRLPGVDDPLYRIPFQPSLDGNTVEMDVERVQFADNTLRQQTDLQVLNQRIKTLLSAIQS